MPKVVDYPTVLELLTQQGLKSLYYNSGAFGFPPSVTVASRGWIAKPDAAIRQAALPLVRMVDEQHLADRFVQLWKAYLPGTVWIMPKSHWAYELEFGSRSWIAEVLESMGIDCQSLAGLNVAPAIEFTEEEEHVLQPFVKALLAHLDGSDFQAVFPGRKTICTIHNRGQLWWTSADPVVVGGMDAVLKGDANEGG
jgi:hypothetical protein